MSQAEIAKRRRINATAAGIFSVGNFPINPDTQHIFEDFVESRIATIKEVKARLHDHYSKIAKLSNP